MAGEAPLFLGVDLGTSSLKLQAVDSRGAAVAEAGAPVQLSIPRPGWAEQDPVGWWAALLSACRDFLAEGRVKPRQIRAIGLTGQMHGAVFLDEQGESLRPCLIWADARTEAQVASMSARIPVDRLVAVTGNLPNTSFTAAKILWVQEEDPEVYARTRHILLPKDYLRLRLTGDYATDASDASATLMFDLKERNWSPELLEAFGIHARLLPTVYESTEVTGTLTREAAQATGLLEGIPVVAGGGDAECSAFGLGLSGGREVRDVALSSIGTSGQVFAVKDRPVIDPLGRVHSLCHVVPGRWHAMGAILAGGVAFRWLRDVLWPPGSEETLSYDALTAEAEQAGIGAGGVLFLPYLLGERTPYMDPHARGVFYGLRLDHVRGHLARAVMEGVVFALRDGLEVFRAIGITPTEVRLAGGGAQSKLWRQLQRDIFGLPVRTSEAEHGAAYGAALLAAVGVGQFSSADEAASLVPLGERSEPDGVNAREYQAIYRKYRNLYPALYSEFQRP